MRCFFQTSNPLPSRHRFDDVPKFYVFFVLPFWSQNGDSKSISIDVVSYFVDFKEYFLLLLISQHYMSKNDQKKHSSSLVGATLKYLLQHLWEEISERKADVTFHSLFLYISHHLGGHFNLEVSFTGATTEVSSCNATVSTPRGFSRRCDHGGFLQGCDLSAFYPVVSSMEWPLAGQVCPHTPY